MSNPPFSREESAQQLRQLLQTLVKQGGYSPQQIAKLWQAWTKSCAVSNPPTPIAFLQKCGISSPLLQQAMKTIQAGKNSTTRSSSGLPIQNAGIKDSHFGKYEILSEVAKGGMGIIYRARKLEDGEIVALKILLDGARASEMMVKRFQREAKATRQLSHANIVPVYDVGQYQEYHYFTMKFVEGCTLQDLFDQDQLAIAEGLAIVEKICDALRYAHRHKVIHRDIKPSNILIDQNGEPYLTDFGLVKMVDASQALTKTGAIVGTPFYMSPEQLQGTRSLDSRTDIYSIGVIIYQVLTKRLPHEAKTIPDLYRKVVKQTPVAPKDIEPSLSEDLNSLCLRCLEKSPALRYSANEVAKNLQRIRGGKKRRMDYSDVKLSLKRWYRRSTPILVVSLLLAGLVWILVSSYFHQYQPDQEIFQQRPLATLLRNARQSLQKQENGKALATLDGLLREYPESEEGYALRAEILLLQGERSLALQDITKAIAINPREQYFWQRGQYLQQLDRDEELLNNYQRAIEKVADPSSQLRQALADQQRKMGYHNDALLNYRLSLQNNENNAEIYIGLLKSSFALRKYDDAFGYSEKILLLPGNPDRRIIARTLYYRGLYYQMQGIGKYAVDCWQKAVDTAAEDVPDACWLLGRHFADNNDPRALPYLQQAAALAPNNIEISAFLAENLMKSQRYEQAIDSYSHCIELEPWNAHHYQQRGLAYRSLGKLTLSNDDFLRCSELDNENFACLLYLYENSMRADSLQKTEDIEAFFVANLLHIYQLTADLFAKEKLLLQTKYMLPFSKKPGGKKEVDPAFFINALVSSGSTKATKLAREKLLQIPDKALVLRTIDAQLATHIEKSTRERLQQVRKSVYREFIEQQKYTVRQLLVRYFVVGDQAAKLQLYRTAEVVVVCEAILRDPKEDVILRFLAAQGLLICLDKGCAMLQQLSLSHDPTTHLFASISMQMAGFPIAEKIFTQLEKLDAFATAIALYNAPDNCLGAVRPFLQSPDKRLQLFAAARLWQAGESSGANALVVAFSDADPTIRSYTQAVFWESVMARKQREPQLYRQYLRNYLPYLIQASRDVDAKVRRAAILYLGKIATKEAADALQPCLYDEEVMVQLQTTFAFGTRGNMKKMVDLALDTKARRIVRLSSFLAMEVAGSNYKYQMGGVFSLLSFLQRLLEDKDYLIRINILQLVGRIGKKSGAQFLLRYLDSEDPHTRYGAVLGLIKYGSPSFLPQLEKLLQDPDANVRKAAATTIVVLVHDHEPQLLEKYYHFFKSQPEEIRRGAAFGYARKVHRLIKLKDVLKRRQVPRELAYSQFFLAMEREIIANQQNYLRKRTKTPLLDKYYKTIQWAVLLDPENDVYHYEKALLHTLRQEYHEALDEAQIAAKLDPREIAYQFGLATIYQKLGRPDQALEMLQNAIHSFPWNRRAWQKKVEILQRLGKAKEAEESKKQGQLLRRLGY